MTTRQRLFYRGVNVLPVVGGAIGYFLWPRAKQRLGRGERVVVHEDDPLTGAQPLYSATKRDDSFACACQGLLGGLATGLLLFGALRRGVGYRATRVIVQAEARSDC